MYLRTIIIIGLLFLGKICNPLYSQNKRDNQNLDSKVQKFLESHADQWFDLNIDEIDGKFLYDLILKKNYKNALEIGTSTGRSTIWIAWALSKTGGKLITIEIDERRYRQALQNFKEAGLSDYIDARLADAHDLVKELKGPFDFIFCDADKGWYKNYFIDLSPKLKKGGCYTAHNISEENQAGRQSSRTNGMEEFLDYIKKQKNYVTKIDNHGGGISTSFKKSEDSHQ